MEPIVRHCEHCHKKMKVIKDDWDKRVLHKSCWKKLEEERSLACYDECS